MKRKVNWNTSTGVGHVIYFTYNVPLIFNEFNKLLFFFNNQLNVRSRQ